MGLRDLLAAGMRRLPPVRGKTRLGLMIQRRLTDETKPHGLIVDFKMRDGSHVSSDLRSPTEAPVYWTGEYDAEIVQIFKRELKPGTVFLDIGANVGYYAIPIGRVLKELGGRVEAFEPFPTNADRIETLIARNHLQGIVHLNRFGLSDSEAEFSIVKGLGEDGATGNAYLVSPGTGTATTVVRTKRLDDAAAERNWKRCDLLKIDVEGFEMHVFRGGLNFLKATRPLIVLEANDYWMKERGWTLGDLLAFFTPLGYIMERKGPHGFMRTTDTTPIGCENVILRPIS